jgi:hypothetical protein
MKISESAKKIRAIVEKAIETHEISREDYDKVIHLATEDAIVDASERALLHELNEMIMEKSIKVVRSS